MDGWVMGEEICRVELRERASERAREKARGENE